MYTKSGLFIGVLDTDESRRGRNKLRSRRNNCETRRRFIDHCNTRPVHVRLSASSGVVARYLSQKRNQLARGRVRSTWFPGEQLRGSRIIGEIELSSRGGSSPAVRQNFFHLSAKRGAAWGRDPEIRATEV